MNKSKLIFLIIISMVFIISLIILTNIMFTYIPNIENYGAKTAMAISGFIIFIFYLIISLYISERKNWIFEAVATENSHKISLYLMRYGYNDVYGSYVDEKIKEISKKMYAYRLNLINSKFNQERAEDIMSELNRSIISLQESIPKSKYPTVYKFYYSCIKLVIREFSIQYYLKGNNSFDEWMAYCLTHFKKNKENLTEYYDKAIDMIVSLPWATKENLDGEETAEVVNNRIDQLCLKLGDIPQYYVDTLKERLINSFLEYRGTDSAFGAQVIYI